MFRAVLLVLVVVAQVHLAYGHARFVCPSPRSPETGLKNGPCGGDGPTVGKVTNFNPGNVTIVFEESITHTGSPFRFALSVDNSDYFGYVLLDHVPHKDGPYDDNGYKQYRLVITLPDINCQGCALQLVNPMTDKVEGECTYSIDGTDTCGSIYHSCANININGATPAATWAETYAYSPPSWWPYRRAPFVYTDESAPYNGPWIVGQSQQNLGTCASVASPLPRTPEENNDGGVASERPLLVGLMIIGLVAAGILL